MKKNVISRKMVSLAMAAVLAGPFMMPATALAAPVTLEDGSIFDPEYYAQQNPDVVAALGTDATILYQHYKTFGKNEGRIPYEPSAATGTTMTLPDGTIFDPVYYAQSNPDVVAVLGTDADLLAQHYIQFGKKEGRKPSVSSTQSTQQSTTEAMDLNYVRWHEYLHMLGHGDYVVGLRESYYTYHEEYMWVPALTIVEVPFEMCKDPALFFDRKDYSSNELYQKIRNEMISLLIQRKEMNEDLLSIRFQMCGNSSKEIRNMLDNLEIDLMKMGYADYINLNAYAANGCLYPNPADKYVAVCSSLVVYDYHNMQGFDDMTDSQIDKEILSKHPELAEVLSRMQNN